MYVPFYTDWGHGAIGKCVCSQTYRETGLKCVLFLSVLLSGQLLSVSPSKLCEAGGAHHGAQKDIRESGPQHLCEFMTCFVKSVFVNVRTHPKLECYKLFLFFSITDVDNV